MPRRGLTLLELLVVLTILISLATLVVPVITTFGRKSQDVATRENLFRLQELLLNQYYADMQELPRPAPANIGDPPKRKNHPQLRYLFVNPDTEDITKTPGATLLSTRRWQGPYIRHSGARYQIDTAGNFTTTYGLGDDETAGTRGDPMIRDAWGRPVVIQEPNVAGNFNPTTEEKNYARLVSAGPDGVIDTPLNVLMPTDVQRDDDVLVFLFRHDEYGADYLKLEP